MQSTEPKNPELFAKALALKSWAADKRFMGAGVAPEKADATFRKAANNAFSEGEQNILMKKGVTAVGVSEKSDTIVLYTNTELNRTGKKNMPDEILEGANLLYRKATAYVLKDDIEDVYIGVNPGRFHKKRYACGSSISIANRRSAGTLGCLVKNAQNELFGLTNNHVTGGCNNTRVGMQVLAPGVRDVMIGQFDPFAIGYHSLVGNMLQGEIDQDRIAKNTDAALFQIKDPKLVSSHQSGYYDTPANIGDFLADPDPSIGTRVKKVGRTSGLTYGFIESRLVGAFPLNYDITTHHSASETVRFLGKVFFDPVYVIRGADGEAFSSRGDSGSLVVTDEDEPKAVGIIFSGNAREKLSYMLQIAPILKTLNVELVSSHGV